MTALDALTAPPKAEPRRDHLGRPYVKLPGAANAQPLTRVTTIANTLSDRFGLEQWAKRNVVLGIAARRDLYALAGSLTVDDRDQLNKLVKDAEEAAGASTGATMGTALHRYTERVDAGEEIEIPAPWDADVAAYKAALDAHGIEILSEWIERFLVCVELGAAGTADRFVRWQGRPGLVVADLKTGKHIDPAQIAIQMAIYAHAETSYNPVTDEHTPMPEVDRHVGLIFHLPVGTAECTIYEVDLEEGWRWAQVAVDVRGWRKTSPARRLEVPTGIAGHVSTSVTNPPFDTERDQWLRTRLAQLKAKYPAALARLASVWPPEIPTFRSEHRHSAEELDRIARLLAQVEAAEQVPFPPTNLPPSKSGLVARLKALPGDLVDQVTADAVASGVPHLLGQGVTVEHLETVAALVEDAEVTAEARGLAASEQLTAAGLSVDQVASVIDGFNLDALDEGQVAQVAALCAVSASLVTTTGTDLVVRLSEVDDFCDAHGKAVVRDTAKALAEEHGRAKPRAATDLSSDPLLFALTRAHLNNKQTKDNQQ